MRRNTAFERASQRGVDWMDINPRPLRTRHRLSNTPARVIHESWDQVFDVLTTSLKNTQK